MGFVPFVVTVRDREYGVTLTFAEQNRSLHVEAGTRFTTEVSDVQTPSAVRLRRRPRARARVARGGRRAARHDLRGRHRLQGRLVARHLARRPARGVRRPRGRPRRARLHDPPLALRRRGRTIAADHVRGPGPRAELGAGRADAGVPLGQGRRDADLPHAARRRRGEGRDASRHAGAGVPLVARRPADCVHRRRSSLRGRGAEGEGGRRPGGRRRDVRLAEAVGPRRRERRRDPAARRRPQRRGVHLVARRDAHRPGRAAHDALRPRAAAGDLRHGGRRRPAHPPDRQRHAGIGPRLGEGRAVDLLHRPGRVALRQRRVEALPDRRDHPRDRAARRQLRVPASRAPRSRPTGGGCSSRAVSGPAGSCAPSTSPRDGSIA